MMKTKKSPRGDIRQRIMTALYAVSPEHVDGMPDMALWPKTRQVADICDESIYTTRRFLLLLEQEGWVRCTHRSIQNSLRWYPVHPQEVYFDSSDESSDE